jgi:hypothetical protein
MRIPVEAGATAVVLIPVEGGLGVSRSVGITQGWTATARERGEDAERESHAGHDGYGLSRKRGMTSSASRRIDAVILSWGR